MAGSVIPEIFDYLERNASRLDFFGVLTLMEGFFSGQGGDLFAKGMIKFGIDTSFAFPGGDIASIKVSDGRVTITPRFMGLANATSPLAHYFVEYAGRIDEIRERIERGDVVDDADLGVLAFVDLLTIFNNRIYILFYRAWQKYAPLRMLPADDPLDRCIAALAGRRHGDEYDPRLLAYTGLFAGTPRGVGGLETLLTGYFDGIPFHIREFMPRWIELPDPPKLGNTTRLGVTATCGTSVFDRTGKFRVTVGPVSKELFETFVSRGDYYVKSVTLIDAYLCEPLEYDFEITMNKSDLRTASLGSEHFKLGMNTVLGDTAGKEGVFSIVMEGGRW